MTSDGPRFFLLGAGFSKPAGLPLAAELLDALIALAKSPPLSPTGTSHLLKDMRRYEEFLADVEPGQAFDLEEFGAWLDLEHTLRMRGSDTWSDEGNESGLQLRWAIGRLLNQSTPARLPEAYLEFARQLSTKDVVATLNYDLLLETALDEIGLPYRRFPNRYSQIYDSHSIVDEGDRGELRLTKLHGSIDWVHWGRDGAIDQSLGLEHLVEGNRRSTDPLLDIAVLPKSTLDKYYGEGHWWSQNPTFLMPPSTAKPLSGSPLVELWNGLGLMSHLGAGLTIIGCSLPRGDPYVLQLLYRIAKDYAYGRHHDGNVWTQNRICVVDYRQEPKDIRQLKERYRFLDSRHTEFLLGGFTLDSIDSIFTMKDNLDRKPWP